MKVVFFVTTGLVGSKQEEIVEFDDNATDKEIDEEFADWLLNIGDRGWYRMDGEQS